MSHYVNFVSQDCSRNKLLQLATVDLSFEYTCIDCIKLPSFIYYEHNFALATEMRKTEYSSRVKLAHSGRA